MAPTADTSNSISPFRERLLSRKLTVGSFLRYPDSNLAELLALQGWDHLVLDGEHGTVEPANCAGMVRACELRGIASLVRTDHRDERLPRFMDTGVTGVHLAGLHDAEEARRALGSVRYTPQGARGLASVRGGNFGIGTSLSDYVQASIQTVAVVAQIETAAAIENIDELLEVEEIDAYFLGPTDLSLSMGVPGVLDNSKVVAALEHASEHVLAAGQTLGAFASSAEEAISWQERGATYIVAGFEGLVRSSSAAYLERVRS